MKYAHAIVVDASGYKVEFVLVRFSGADGGETPEVCHYRLKAGESLVFEGVADALTMLRPRWHQGTWRETATEGELAALQEQREQEVVPSGLEALMAEVESALAQQQDMFYQAMTEFTLLIAGGV